MDRFLRGVMSVVLGMVLFGIGHCLCEEGYLEVLNHYSTPSIGGEWGVHFLTNGNGRLIVQNLNQDEVIFKALYYYDFDTSSYKEVMVEEKDGEISAKWAYEMGKVIYSPKVKGEHRLRILFMGEEEICYNHASGTEVVSSESTSSSWDPAIAVDEDYVYITWGDDTDLGEDGTDYDIFYKASLHPSPTISGINPDRGENTGTVSCIITGRDFMDGGRVCLRRTGEREIVGSEVRSATEISARFDLTGARVGRWDVVVTNPNGRSGTLSGGFLVTSSAGPGKIKPIHNLFNPLEGEVCTIEYNLEEPGDVLIRIYTIDGTLVRRLVDDDKAVGDHSVDWDGTNDDGDVVASGVYILYIRAPGFSDTKKICVIK